MNSRAPQVQAYDDMANNNVFPTGIDSPYPSSFTVLGRQSLDVVSPLNNAAHSTSRHAAYRLWEQAGERPPQVAYPSYLGAVEPYILPTSLRRPTPSPVGRITHPWTTDSPSRAAYPNHLSRPLTRPPIYAAAYSDVVSQASLPSSPSERRLVSAPDQMLAERLSRYRDSDRPAYPPSIGGPPKAVLGGPGGKTYDEMVKSGQSSSHLPKRAVSSPFPSTPDPTPKKDSEAQRDILWNGREVPVKIPHASHSPPNSPNGDNTLVSAMPQPKGRKAYSPSRPVDEQSDEDTVDLPKSSSPTLSILKPSVLSVSLHPASYHPMTNIRSSSSASDPSFAAGTRGLRPTAPEFQPKFISSTSTSASTSASTSTLNSSHSLFRPRVFSDSSSAIDSVKVGIKERLRPDAQPFVPGALSDVESSANAKSLPAASRRGVSLDTTFDPLEYEREDKVEEDEGLEPPGEKDGHVPTRLKRSRSQDEIDDAKVAKTFHFDATAKPFISKTSPSTSKLGVPNPLTPLNRETNSTRRNSLEDTMTSVAYSTVDGSPLIPRRVLSDASSRNVLSDIDRHGPRPRLGDTYDLRYNEQVILDDDDDDDDDNDVRPSNSNSNDQRFLDWVFPHSATRPKPPSISRRHTVPISDDMSHGHDRHVLPGAGVASTSLAMRVDDLRAALAERRQSSVEFPKRETKLTVVNITPRLEHTESFTGLVGLVHSPDHMDTTDSFNIPVRSPDHMDTRDMEELRERSDELDMVELRERRDKTDMVELRERRDKTDMSELAQLMMKIGMEESIRKLPLEKLIREVQDMKDILSDVIQGTRDSVFDLRLEKLQTTLADHGFVLSRLANQTPAGAMAFQEILSSLSAGQQAIIDGVSEVVQGQRDLLDLKVSLSVAQDQVEHRDADLLLNRQAIEELQRGVRTLTANLQDAEKALWQVERGKDGMEKERDHLRSVVEKQLGEYAKTKTRLDEVESEKRAVEGDRDSRASTVVSLRQLLEDKERENETLRSEISMARERQRSIDAERVILTSQLDDVSRVTTSLQTQMLERFDSLQDALRAKNALENQTQSQQSNELRDKLDTAQRQVIELEHSFVSAQSQKMDLAAQISTEQQARKQVERRLEAIQHRLEVAEKGRMDAQLLAFERQSAAKMSESHLRSLTRENHIWRSFAVEADGNKYRKFILSQPFSGLSETHNNNNNIDNKNNNININNHNINATNNSNNNIGASRKNEDKGKENVDHVRLKAEWYSRG